MRTHAGRPCGPVHPAPMRTHAGRPLGPTHFVPLRTHAGRPCGPTHPAPMRTHACLRTPVDRCTLHPCGLMLAAPEDQHSC
eukprot:1795978-Pleurochrysis_carterae.AAC.2